MADRCGGGAGRGPRDRRTGRRRRARADAPTEVSAPQSVARFQPDASPTAASVALPKTLSCAHRPASGWRHRIPASLVFAPSSPDARGPPGMVAERRRWSPHLTAPWSSPIAGLARASPTTTSVRTAVSREPGTSRSTGQISRLRRSRWRQTSRSNRCRAPEFREPMHRMESRDHSDRYDPPASAFVARIDSPRLAPESRAPIDPWLGPPGSPGPVLSPGRC